jgi:hypothetical protein
MATMTAMAETAMATAMAMMPPPVDDVDEDNGSNSRTAIGQWQLDDNNGTTKMGQ